MVRRLLILLALLLPLAACGDPGGGGDDGGPPIDAPGARALRLDTSALTLDLGDRHAIRATYVRDGVTTPAADVTWTSTAPAVATVTGGADGLADVAAVSPGSATIRATGVDGLTAEATITVAPPRVASITVGAAATALYVGGTTALTATAVYTDQHTEDVTGQATWASQDGAVITVDASGTARAVGAGVTRATATFGGQTGSVELTITAVAIVSVRITPLSFTMAAGQTRQLTATATNNDGSTTDVTGVVMWVAGTGTSPVFTISAGGLVTGTEVGAENVYAKLGGVVVDFITVTITEATLASLTITPAGATVGVGQARQYQATAVYTDGTMTDVTTSVSWFTGDATIAAVGDGPGTRGLVIGKAAGTTSVSAVGGVAGSTMVTVGGTPPLVTAITPADGATGIAPLAPLTVRFSRAMVPASLAVQNAAGPCTGAIQLSRDHFVSCLPFAGPAVMSDGDRLATLTPRPALALGIAYRLRVLGTVQPVVGAPTGADVVQLGWRTERPAYKCATRLTISQVYGGGGNAGAPYRSDFVELHNPGPAPVSLAGLALFLASPLGTTWTRQPLPAATIPPGGYYLIEEGSGGAVGAALPTPDFVPATPFPLGATAGKVALAPAVNDVTDACAGVDAWSNVAYGNADCSEGFPAPALTNTTAAVRLLGGCSDKFDNERDFAAVAPAPRNLATAPAVCSCAVNESEGFATAAELAFCSLDTPPTITVATGAMTPMIMGRVADPDQTDPPAGNPLIRYQIGYGPPTVNPEVEPGFTWSPTLFDGQESWFLSVFAYRFRATLLAPAPGDYVVGARVSLDGVNWTYCDGDGAGDTSDLSFLPFEFDPLRLRPMTVTP